MFRKVLMSAAAAASLACVGAAWAGPADDPANWRKVDPENLLQFMINKQEVLIELRPDIAPGHVEQVKKITRDTNYDKLPFHRVIDDFMAQGGEVYAVYQIYPRYPALKGEFTWKRNPTKQKVQWFGATPTGDKLGYLDGFLVQGQPDETAMISDPPVAKTWGLHCAGVTSMARSNEPDSADTQFFLMRQPRVGPDGLDAKYTVWGRALTGVDVIQGIKAGPMESDGRFASPTQADKLTKAMVVADIPEKKRPTVYVRRTDGPEFAATLATLKASDPYEACQLPPVEVIVERPTP
ncbi:MAG: peptidylprolyl isomerase [Hyphomonadaceae bacterium]|nr:peptidylprolyl isomerase [Hyphomonadaceae bacterium]